jgi:hypothetical protein
MGLRRLRVKLARRRHEARQRAAFRLSTWLENPQTATSIDGDFELLGPNICIFAASNLGKKILASVRSLIHAITTAGYATVVVMNGPRVERGWFEGAISQSDVIISRPNRGRDFAAFQLATGLLLDRRKEIDRLLYCNDSIFFLDKNDRKKVFSHLIASADPWVGITENHQPIYHVSSWCFQVSQEILKSPAFAAFWRSYLPIDSRIHAIKKGEIGISRTLLKAGFSPTVMFTANSLLRALLEKNRLNAPSHILNELGVFARADLNERTETTDAVRSLFQGEKHNQTAFLGVPFMAEMGFPFLKKDVVYRGVYPMSLALLLLEELMSGFGPETVNELHMRGTRSSLSSDKKLLFDAGAI